MPHDYTDNTRGIRLQKAMAESGIASRRACEELIEAGRVTVNGQRIDALPAWVDPAQDTIAIDGQSLPRTARSRRGKEHTAVGKSYVVVNKPRGVICTNDDPQGRERIIDLVDDPILNRKRLYPVGRLDTESTGIILLTDDGDLTQRLTHASFGVTKEYRVTVTGKVSFDDLTKLRKIICKTGTGKTKKPKPKAEGASTPVRPKPDEEPDAMQAVRIVGVETDRARGDRTELAIVLHENKNRDLRLILARLGIKVRKLKRVSIGPIQLKTLRSGSWRELTTLEVRTLRKSVGLK